MKNTRSDRIDSWIAENQASMIRDLCDLVAVNSVSDPEGTDPLFGEGCQMVLSMMLDKGKEMGLSATNYMDCCGSLSLDGGEKENAKAYTGIWCHLDVVPPGDGWNTMPFEPCVHDGLLTGRGSQDNKASAVMGLYLLKFLKEKKITLKQPVALYFGTNEECGMKDIDRFLRHYQTPGVSLIADCAFPVCYGEKGDLVVRFIDHKRTGYQVKELTAGIAHNVIPGNASAEVCLNGRTVFVNAEGKSGHSADPKSGENAIVPLLEQIAAIPEVSQKDREILKKWENIVRSTDGSVLGIYTPDSIFGNLTCCAAKLLWEEGCWALEMDIRYPASCTSDELEEKLATFAEEQNLEMQIRSSLPAFGYSPDQSLIRSLTDIYNRETDRCSQPYAMAGGTYAAKLPHAIPFGISFPEKDLIVKHYPKGHGDYHQPDESVILDQIFRALKIYLTAILETDGKRFL